MDNKIGLNCFLPAESCQFVELGGETRKSLGSPRARVELGGKGAERGAGKRLGRDLSRERTLGAHTVPTMEVGRACLA